MTAMNTRLFAREYARVLDGFAADEREAVRSYFRTLCTAAERASGLKSFLDHPAIPDADKTRFLASIAPRRFSPVVGRILGDIIKRRMTFLFSDIAEEMQRLSDESNNIHSVVVTSAAPLPERQRRTLIERLQTSLAGKVKVAFAVDRTLLAGFSIKTGGSVMDNSIQTDLEHIRRKLLTVSST
jgi:ATP synthase F1 delta subunit